MTDYNFISADDKKFHLDQTKLIDIYYQFKNNKKLIKPLKKKLKKLILLIYLIILMNLI